MSVHGRELASTELSLISEVSVSPTIMGVGVGLALSIGLLGGLVAAVQVYRMDLIEGLGE